jgi:hypothetical protein
MRLARLLVVVLTAVTLGVAASGCGGGKSYSGTKPGTWAASVCGALTTWRDSLRSGSQSLNADLQNVRDLQAVKTRFIVFLQNAERSTKTMIADVKATGAPAVKDGAAIQHDLESGLTRARASFTRAIAGAQDLSTKNPRAFSSGVQDLGQNVQRELATIGNNFANLDEKYDADELKEATAKESACDSIRSGQAG